MYKPFLVLCYLTGTFAYHATALSQSVQAEKKAQYDRVYQQAIRTGEALDLAEAYFLYGKYYHGEANYVKATEQFLKALEIHKSYPPSFEYGRVFSRLAIIGYVTGNREQALAYAKKAKAVFVAAKSEKGIRMIEGFYTELHEKNEGNSNLSSPVLLDSAAIVEQWFVQALRLYNKKEYLQSLHLYQQLYEYHIQHHKFYEALQSKLSIAENYISLKRLDTAEKLINETEGHINTYYKETFDIVRHLLLVKVNLAVQQNDWQKAFYLNDTLNKLELKLFKVNESGAISKLNIAYETKEKEFTIQNQKETLSQRNIFLMISGFFVAVLAVTAFYLYRLFTKYKALELRNGWLLKEQNHRIKNNLQAISSILNMQSRRLSDGEVKQTVEESKLRIEAMAILQRLLYEDKANNSTTVSSKGFIEELVNGILSAYENKDLSIETKLSIEDVQLSPETSLPIGLILTEVLTNTCKYAFPNNIGGKIEIGFKKVSNELFRLAAEDNGVGFNYELVDKNSFGMRLINIQVQQLRGNFVFHNKQGTLFTMTGQIG